VVCAAPQRQWRSAITAKRVVCGLLGVACLVLSVILDWSSGTSTDLLLLAGFLFLTFACGLPIATVAEVGGPIGKLVAAFAERGQAMKARIRSHLQRSLLAVAEDVVLDDDRARAIVEEAIERVAAAWRGPVDGALDRLLYCWVIHLSVNDSRSDPVVAADDPRWLLSRMTRRERTVQVLRRQQKSEEEIAEVLGCAVAELPPVSASGRQ
jgi:hypothetical protein